MINLYIYCEGETEESFINEILTPYFVNLSILVIPIICTTKRTKSVKYSGGVSDYSKIKNELPILCKTHKNEYVTTMFDYYGMPSNTPDINNQEIDIYKRMEYIEQAINKDLNQPNLFFNLILHEFEGLLFSSPQAFRCVTHEENVEKIKCIRSEFETPEHINNSRLTAPSKRLEELMPRYPKIKFGTIVSKEIGIDTIMAKCKHFKLWIDKIKELANQ